MQSFVNNRWIAQVNFFLWIAVVYKMLWTHTFSLGRRQMSFMWHLVFLFVKAWYMGVKLERMHA